MSGRARPATRSSSRYSGRVGLVLGAGGVLGAAWTTGALAALQARLPRPVEEADVVVGTSAGSILAAALRCGFGVAELVAYQQGTVPGLQGALGAPDLGYPCFPPWPSWWMGSPRLLMKALRAPGTVHPWTLAAACLPRGRAEHVALRSMVDGLLAGHPRPGAPRRTAGRKPPASRCRPRGLGRSLAKPRGQRAWITAVDYDSGRRVAFGRPGAPPATLPDAVVASCSVPGWFRPTVIDGRRYIDGGVRSGTNADLLAGAGLDEAYVLAPAASLVAYSPCGPLAWFERLVRNRMTAALRREMALLRDGGTQVTVLTPGPEDLAAMGGNLMDHHRRQAVFETALITSAAALERAAPDMPGAA